MSSDEPPIWDDVPFPAEAHEGVGAVMVRNGYDAAPRQGPTPPHDIDAEREILAAVIIACGDLDADDALEYKPSLASKLRAEGVKALASFRALGTSAFYLERHQLIGDAMLAVIGSSRPPDPVLIAAEMKARGTWERAGGARSIGELMDRCGDVTNVEHYCAIVRAKAQLRLMVDAARSIEVAGLQDVHPGDVGEFLAESLRSVTAASKGASTDGLDLAEWTSSRYEGNAPPVSWIVPSMIARGESHVLAAPGESGKGFKTLSLALQLASGIYAHGRRAPFGCNIPPITEPVGVAAFYAEDAADALHRRLEAIDPDGSIRRKAGDRFHAVALPSAGGVMSIIERAENGTYRPSSAWLRIVERLSRIPDLGLGIFDPLSCFVAFDVNSDSNAAQSAMGELSRAATELDAAMLITHHMRKASDETKNPRAPEVPTHDEVRARIRGVAALLDGVRMAYGIVPMPSRYAKAILTKLGEHGVFDVAKVYWGAVVKANGLLDRRPRIYVRHACGLLEDRTGDIVVPGARLEDALRQLVSKGA